jgi:hypothetical protein
VPNRSILHQNALEMLAGASPIGLLRRSRTTRSSELRLLPVCLLSKAPNFAVVTTSGRDKISSAGRPLLCPTDRYSENLSPSLKTLRALDIALPARKLVRQISTVRPIARNVARDGGTEH